ncbi:asparaginase-domain-containing protein [Tilletiaria anomala UBC 951]|uniref:asparaginase n=1 Tax=Tilletiaria anomala (strain ATCC 24038 / CBS 436.72 / UBC 951) TaxID=1037660 RepID=A0A066VI08_TILAU|nr:asparaginase-domain-containing protein [Tilletiaria anomala UBC 951]KDN39943.1 asparaginase-domain-containing protein [Tilletiaria anomala UBC 951]
MASESLVLCLYAGGTIGMIRHPLHGYQPHPSFLTETLRTQARFHDPFANSIFSWSDSVDRYQQWSGVHSAGGSARASRAPSPDNSSGRQREAQGSAGAAPAPASAQRLPELPPTAIREGRDSGTDNGAPPQVWPPFGSYVTVRSSSVKGTSTLNARDVKVVNVSSAAVDSPSSVNELGQGQEQVLEMRLPTMITPKGASGKRVRYAVLEYDPLLDSSEMTFSDWKRLSRDIALNYAQFDAFIVLHGTDTMAYTASALSMLLENLGKSVIVTGAQVPLSELRNDAIENMLGALTLAGDYILPEVTLYFASKLYRGNRTSKTSNDALAAFDSPNMPPLASVGIDIRVHWQLVQRPRELRALRAHTQLCENVAILRLFPGLPRSLVRSILAEPTQGVVLETFGAGNAGSSLLDLFAEASARGVVIVNITQCLQGTVSNIYAAGKKLEDAGVVSGKDMTPECALIKLAYLLGKPELSRNDVRNLIGRSLRGEITATAPVASRNHEHADAAAAAAAAADPGAPVEDQGAETTPRIQELVADILYQSSSPAAPGAAHATKTTASWTITAHEVQAADRAILPHLILKAVQDGNAEALRYHLQKVEKFERTSDDLSTAMALTAASAANTAGARGRNATPVSDARPLASAAATATAAAVGKVNLIDEQQALHHASAQGKDDLVAMLLAAGASVHLRDHYGFSPLFAAVRAGHTHVASLLKATGAHLKADEVGLLEQLFIQRPEVRRALEVAM